MYLIVLTLILFTNLLWQIATLVSAQADPTSIVGKNLSVSVLGLKVSGFEASGLQIRITVGFRVSSLGV